MPTKFERMNQPYVYGFSAESSNGLTVEVVRCYENEWNVFLTRQGHVVACSIEEYRQCGHGYVTKSEAYKIARKHL